jgi:hypothetical protein
LIANIIIIILLLLIHFIFSLIALTHLFLLLLL